MNNYLPPGLTLSSSGQAVTFEQLATFTGGIPGDNPAQTQPAFQCTDGFDGLISRLQSH